MKKKSGFRRHADAVKSGFAPSGSITISNHTPYPDLKRFWNCARVIDDGQGFGEPAAMKEAA
jgi:hypothetical protein